MQDLLKGDDELSADGGLRGSDDGDDAGPHGGFLVVGDGAGRGGGVLGFGPAATDAVLEVHHRCRRSWLV